MVIAAGDLAAALTAYHAAWRSPPSGVAGPANTEWQRDLSVSHNKLGDVAMAAGDLAAARTAYQASLDIAARLAAADPANTTWQRDLSQPQQAGGCGEGGRGPGRRRTAYQASQDIRTRLAPADPANTGQRDLQRARQRSTTSPTDHGSSLDAESTASPAPR